MVKITNGDQKMFSTLGREIRNRKKKDINRKVSFKENEEHEFIISPEDISDEYEQYPNQNGLFVLFNQEKCKIEPNSIQKSITKDQEDLIECFNRINYNVKKEYIFNDLQISEIVRKLKDISEMDHTETSSLIMIFLTHGDLAGVIHGSDEAKITSQHVMNCFSVDNCPSLRGKPKIFIFQACKGTELTVTEDLIQTEREKKCAFPVEADTLVTYSSFEGSHGNEVAGTRFIQELCKNLIAYGHRDDVVSILTRVSKCITYYSDYNYHKQMPLFGSTLTKKFYVCKSKYRDYLYELNNQSKSTLNILKKLENHFGISDAREKRQKTKFLKIIANKEDDDKDGDCGSTPWMCNYFVCVFVATLFFYVFTVSAYAYFIEK